MKPLHRAEIDYLDHLFSLSTAGVWTPTHGCVVSTADLDSMDADCLNFYGGNLLAESIAVAANAKWIAAAHNEFPRILAALKTKAVLG